MYWCLDRLQDAPAVRTDAWSRNFHAAGFAPFLFFDLDASAEARDGPAMSLRNPQEARLVVNVYSTIRELASDGKADLPKGPPWAAVITPYTEQLSELRGCFEPWRYCLQSYLCHICVDLSCQTRNTTGW